MKSKLYVHFVGYNKNSKIPTMSLNAQNNKYCCSRCGAGGYSVGLYAKVKCIDNKQAYKELLARECFSQDRVNIEISPINLLADIGIRDKIYREFLSMLKLEPHHRVKLRELGFLDSSIDAGLYKSIPKKYIKRRLIGNALSKKYNLCGIPGLFQEEDFKWCFNRFDGFFVPVLDQNGLIEGLSIHLDKPFNKSEDIWFSSGGKINGTSAKSWIMRNNIRQDAENIIITDNLLLGYLLKETKNLPMISFQNITNSYMILKELENTNITNIIFVFRLPYLNENIDYIIRRILRDLLPLGYNIDTKFITDYKEIFDIYFNDNYKLKKVA